MILVGDIGGTNTRLALAERRDDGYRVDRLERFPTPADLPALVRRYLDGFADVPVEAAALCGAGPVMEDGSIALTNNPCRLEPAPLAAACRLAGVRVVNDFEALAHAVPALGLSDLRRCGGIGEGIASAPRLVIGPGTGLGVASLVPHRGEWRVLPGEGGHVDLAPVDDEEVILWRRMRDASGALSAESLLSGSGFERLFTAMTGRRLPAPRIDELARAGDDAALRAMRVFSRWLGRVAGNAALTIGARGGVYLAGGILPAWGPLFDVEQFRLGFEAKPGFEDWLAIVPAYLMTHAEPALIGLALLAGSA